MSGCLRINNMGRPTIANDLKDLLPGEGAAAEVGEVASDQQDDDQLHPFRGLKLHGPQLDPAASAEGLVADAGHQHGHQREQEESVKPGGKIDELVVVDFGEQEHGHQAAADVKELLFVEVAVGVLGVEGGGVDLHDGDGAEQEHHQQQAPVEIAKAHEAAHQWRSLRQRTGTAENSEAKSADCMGRALAGLAWGDEEVPGVQHISLFGGLAARTRGRGGPDCAHFNGLVGLAGPLEVAILLTHLVHVGDDQGLGDVGGVRAPVAVLLEHHDGKLGIAPGHHAHEPGVGGALAALHVGVAAAHHLGGAGFAGEVHALNVRAFRSVVQAERRRCRHAVGDGGPGVVRDGHVLVAGAGERVQQRLAEIGAEAGWDRPCGGERSGHRRRCRKARAEAGWA